MRESENALWAKTRRRNMAANRRRTERSESAAERAHKALFFSQAAALSPRAAERARKVPRPAAPTAPPLSAPRRTPCRAVFCSPLLRPPGRKKARPAGAPFLKGRHKFALWNDTIALRLKKTGRAPAGAPFLKGHHKFALWNDTIALRLKNRVAPLFPQSARQKQRPPGAPLRGGKSPAKRPDLQAAVRKKQARQKPRA